MAGPGSARVRDGELGRGGLIAGGSGFVNRRRELDGLEELLAQARSGRPRLALIEGDPGIGKTRLLREFRARASGVRVFDGRAYEHLSLPYLPFTQILETQLGDPDSDVSRRAAALLGYLRGGQGAAGATPEPASSSSPERLELFAAGIMALFGAPIAHEDHAQRACYAALHLRDELRRHGDELRLQRGLDFATRMGLNSGDVVVGKIGDDLRMDYTAQGHAVGLAQRMEQIAEVGRVYLSEHTARLVEGWFRPRDVGPTECEGVSEPVRVHELEGPGELRSPASPVSFRRRASDRVNPNGNHGSDATAIRSVPSPPRR